MYVRATGGGLPAPILWRNTTVLLTAGGSPSPVLFGPLQASLYNAATGLGIYPGDEGLASIYAILTDSPPVGTNSALNLIGAMVAYKLRPVNAAAPILSGNGRIANPLTFEVAYDFQPADLTMLASLLQGVSIVCHSAFIVTWPGGQAREFLVTQPVVLYPSAF